MAFLETERIERDEKRKAQLEVARVMCPWCGASVVVRHGRGRCDVCGHDPEDDDRPRD